jgi:deoxyribonuclease IV
VNTSLPVQPIDPLTIDRQVIDPKIDRRMGFDESEEWIPQPELPPAPAAWIVAGGPRVGIHTSIAKSAINALEIAHGLGANALQIFSANPRQWWRERETARIAEVDAGRFRARRHELALGPLVIHCNYLINMASAQRVLRARSVQAFHLELVRAKALGADFLVLHPGACCGAERGPSIGLIADGLRQAARGLKLDGLRILLENTAGQGTCVGAEFAELKTIMDLCPQLPLGICVDTAHLLAAGHNICTVEGLDSALRNIDAAVGLANVHVVHVNDSKMPLGSRVDRHDHIGNGYIGLEAFGRIVNHPLLTGRAFILETPIDKPGDDLRNVRAIWKCLGRVVARPKGKVRDGFAAKNPSGRSRRHAGVTAAADQRAVRRATAGGAPAETSKAKAKTKRRRTARTTRGKPSPARSVA